MFWSAPKIKMAYLLIKYLNHDLGIIILKEILNRISDWCFKKAGKRRSMTDYQRGYCDAMIETMDYVNYLREERFLEKGNHALCFLKLRKVEKNG